MKKKAMIVRTGVIMAMALMATACAHSQQPHDSYGTGSADSGFYDGVIGFYTGPLNHLSGVRRGGCPMHPSCAQYSREAVEKNGFVIGWIMTMDRLLRCGRDELKTAPRVFVNGDWKYYDPVDRNRAGRQSDGTPLSEKAARTAKSQKPLPRTTPRSLRRSMNDRLPPAYTVNQAPQ